MFKATFENYKNYFDRFYEDRTFQSLNELEEFLLRAYTERDKTSKSSVYWKSPVGTRTENGEYWGWYRVNSTSPNKYDLWLTKVVYNGDVIVFEANNYCSAKFYDFLNQLNQKICVKPVYGDF